MQKLTCCALLLATARALTPQGPTRIVIYTVTESVIQQRLERVVRKIAERKIVLETLFQEAGCAGDRLTNQPVPHSKEPNVICTLPGEGQGTIVVGGHFDLVSLGMGVVDDWSGAALLPSLYESLQSKPRRHRIVFIGFASEERGLVGSTEYVRKLSAEERSTVRAMVNLECLGLTPPKVWSHRADKTLADAYLAVSAALHMEAVGSNVEKVGDDDSHPFLNARIPVITIHSITQETFGILHSVRDNLKAIRPADYYAAYRLAATYLAYLDGKLE